MPPANGRTLWTRLVGMTIQNGDRRFVNRVDRGLGSSSFFVELDGPDLKTVVFSFLL